MSLKAFVQRPEVAAKLKPLRPKLPRAIGAPIKVRARTNRHGLVGTAFDYLLRFEIQRRKPNVQCREWVALDAARTAAFRLDPAQLPAGLSRDELEEKLLGIVLKAKYDVLGFQRSKAPSRAEKENVAAHAVRLARLDPIIRAGLFDPEFELVDPADVANLLELLDVVPFDGLS